MTDHATEYDRDEWFANVIRSPLDDRVWCAVIPDVDQHDGTMHASISVRRTKEYAEGEARRYAGADVDLTWIRDDGGWLLVREPLNRPGTADGESDG